MSKKTKAEVICAKISPKIAPEFFEGKRDLEEFEDLLERLRDREDLTKDEFQYIRKNPRHILRGLQLFYLVPELYDRRNTPTVFIQISSLMALRLLRDGKVQVIEEAVKVLSDQIRETLGTPMTSVITADTVGDKIRVLKDEITRIYKDEDVEEIQKAILRVKEDIFESVGMSTILHEMDRYSRELKKSGLPEYHGLIFTLDKWAERFDANDSSS